MGRRFNTNRRGGACAGVLFGLLFLGASFPLLWWNEGRALNRYKTLKEGESIVVSIDALEVDDAHNGGLVHLNAEATTDEILADDVFGVKVQAIRLDRNAQMYQWEEEEHQETHEDSSGNSYTTTYYTYHKTWAHRVIDSDRFDERGHDNPGSMPYNTQSTHANRVDVGNFVLSEKLVSKITTTELLPLEAMTTPPENFAPHDGWLHLGPPRSPAQIGDFRVRFAAVLPQPVSVVAGQTGEILGPYTSAVGGTIELLREGTHTAESMFAREHRTNTIITWALRAGGTLSMFLGFLMLFGPISAITRRIPGVRTIVNAGVGIVSFGLAVSFSLTTISIAWLAYRPTLAWILVAIGTVIVVTLYVRGRRA